MLVLLRFKQKGHRNLCGRNRSYQGIWRKVKLRLSVDSIRHPNIERMAWSRKIKWKIRGIGELSISEVKWEPGTTRNHKTFHAQAAQRPPKKINVGRGRLLNRSIRTKNSKNKSKRQKPREERGRLKAGNVKEEKRRWKRWPFQFPGDALSQTSLSFIGHAYSGAYYHSNLYFNACLLLISPVLRTLYYFLHSFFPVSFFQPPGTEGGLTFHHISDTS